MGMRQRRLQCRGGRVLARADLLLHERQRLQDRQVRQDDGQNDVSCTSCSGSGAADGFDCQLGSPGVAASCTSSTFSYTPSNLTAAQLSALAPVNAVDLSCSGTLTYNGSTWSGATCSQTLPTPKVVPQTGGPSIDVLAFKGLTIGSGVVLKLTGSNAVMIVVVGDATILGTIHADGAMGVSNSSNAGGSGPGGNYSCGSSKGGNGGGDHTSGGGGGGASSKGGNGASGVGGTGGTQESRSLLRPRAPSAVDARRHQRILGMHDLRRRRWRRVANLGGGNAHRLRNYHRQRRHGGNSACTSTGCAPGPNQRTAEGPAAEDRAAPSFSRARASRPREAPSRPTAAREAIPTLTLMEKGERRRRRDERRTAGRGRNRFGQRTLWERRRERRRRRRRVRTWCRHASAPQPRRASASRTLSARPASASAQASAEDGLEPMQRHRRARPHELRDHQCRADRLCLSYGQLQRRRDPGGQVQLGRCGVLVHGRCPMLWRLVRFVGWVQRRSLHRIRNGRRVPLRALTARRVNVLVASPQSRRPRTRAPERSSARRASRGEPSLLGELGRWRARADPVPRDRRRARRGPSSRAGSGGAGKGIDGVERAEDPEACSAVAHAKSAAAASQSSSRKTRTRLGVTRDLREHAQTRPSRAPRRPRSRPSRAPVSRGTSISARDRGAARRGRRRTRSRSPRRERARRRASLRPAARERARGRWCHAAWATTSASIVVGHDVSPRVGGPKGEVQQERAIRPP